MDIKNKSAIVTGGASGMGEAIVRDLVLRGARVAIFDLNVENCGDLTADLGDKVLTIRTDVGDATSVANSVRQAIAAFGNIHICCNFAGITAALKTVSPRGPFPLDVFEHVIRTNLTGSFDIVRLVASEMAKNNPFDEDGARGVIINVASVAAFEGQAGQAAYSASKGGIASMTLPLARDLAPYGIRVNTLCPGAIYTPMVHKSPPHLLDALTQHILFPRRLGNVEEIASLVAFICENNYVNATCIRLDGGLRLPGT